MRFRSLSLALLSCLLLSPAPSPAAQEKGALVPFISPVAKFSLGIPDGWDKSDDPQVLKPVDPSGMITFLALRPAKGGADDFSESVNIRREKLPLGINTVLVAFIPVERAGYVITCTAPSATFDRCRPLFEQMLATFRPGK